MSSDDNSQPYLFGYEWAFFCSECDSLLDLSGAVGLDGDVNGEVRTREIEDGFEASCSNCPATYEINITKT